jgi:hypothetical protein
VTKRIAIGLDAHNPLVSLNGRFLYVGTQTMSTVFDTLNESLVSHVGFDVMATGAAVKMMGV